MGSIANSHHRPPLLVTILSIPILLPVFFYKPLVRHIKKTREDRRRVGAIRHICRASRRGDHNNQQRWALLKYVNPAFEKIYGYFL